MAQSKNLNNITVRDYSDDDLEDDQFKRARQDTSIFPHTELQSQNNNDNKNDDDDKNNDDDDKLFFGGFINDVNDNDDDDDDGEFPFDKLNTNKSIKKNTSTTINGNNPSKNVTATTNGNTHQVPTVDDKKDKDPVINPLYVYNYWIRYHKLTLYWPHCDGNCGNKLGKLIHDKLYDDICSNSSYNLHNINNNNINQTPTPHSPNQDQSSLYIDNYSLTTDDVNAINFFSKLNPMQIQTDMIIQIWSFLDNLRVRVNEFKTEMTLIEHEKKIHSLINRDIESTLKLNEIISKHFLCYSTPIRRYLISLLESFNPNNYHNNNNNPNNSEEYLMYVSLYKLLANKRNIISSSSLCSLIWSYLNTFCNTYNYFILFQLSRYSCNYRTNTIYEELKRNGYHTISPNLYTTEMIRIISSSQYSVMSKYNLSLTAEEIISILIYTGSDQISQRIRNSLIIATGIRTCKWMHITNNLISAVDKIHKVLVQTKYNADLPNNLYYSMHFNQNNSFLNLKQIQYFDVISTTSSKNLALKSIKKGTVIVFKNTHDMLQTSKFIAAPLNWITNRDNKNGEEWLITCIKIHKAIKEKKINNNCNIEIITCIDYETIQYRSMNTYRRVIDATMILDQSNDLLSSSTNCMILNNCTYKCIYCYNVSPIYWYCGNLLYDNMECCFCRRLNIFSYNINERIIKCFGCKQESMLSEFIIERNNDYDGKGAACPKCNSFQSTCWLKSIQYKNILKYLSENKSNAAAGYQKYQKRIKNNIKKINKIKNDIDIKIKSQKTIVKNIGGINNDNNSDKNKNNSSFWDFSNSWITKINNSIKLNVIKEQTSIVEEKFD